MSGPNADFQARLERRNARVAAERAANPRKRIKESGSGGVPVLSAAIGIACGFAVAKSVVFLNKNYEPVIAAFETNPDSALAQQGDAMLLMLLGAVLVLFLYLIFGLFSARRRRSLGYFLMAFVGGLGFQGAVAAMSGGGA